MKNIEQKALALVNEAAEGLYYEPDDFETERRDVFKALCRAIEQHEFTKAAHAATIEGLLKSHEAFRQEVSDAVYAYVHATGGGVDEWENLKSLIIPKPKPDPLAQVLEDIGWGSDEEEVGNLRAALEARGLEIREKGQ